MRPPRCTDCDKFGYTTLEQAEEAAEGSAKRYGKPFAAYFKPKCGFWHITGTRKYFLRAAKNRSIFAPMKLRDYQQAANDATFRYFQEHSGNPLVAMPTGTGKSLVLGSFVRDAYLRYPGTRIMLLTHVRELIKQDLRALLRVWPTAPVGVYSAGLKKKETHAPITFASIQSVRKKAELFGEVHLVLIDEAHLVSPKESTGYRRFIEDLQKTNPYLKVIGYTATPFRLGQGMLTDEGGLFTDVCFDLTTRESFTWLIEQGWLAPLIPKRTREQLDVAGVKVTSGDFNQKELQLAVDVDAITHAALDEAKELAHDRKKWMVFTTGIEHTEHVTGILIDKGISAAAVHSGNSEEVNDDRIAAFKKGQIRALVNNNMLTTGFDCPDVDCIIVLRPTASPVLWVQMLGRGTRPAPGKENCLVLDFAGNTARLGPINDPVIPKRKGKGPPGVAPVRLCEQCGCYSHASARVCQNPDCGVEFPKTIKITANASVQELIAGITHPIETVPVDKVIYRVHKKEGRPDSMRVDYYSGLRRFSEYICLDHGGYAERQARQWWELRCPWGVPPSVHDGMMAVNDLKVPSKIHVMMKPRYPEITGYEFD